MSARTARPSRRSARSRVAALVLVAVLGTPSLWIVAGHPLVILFEYMAEHLWSRDFQATPDLVARYPDASESAAAARLDDLLRPLGLSILEGQSPAEIEEGADAFPPKAGPRSSDEPLVVPEALDGFVGRHRVVLDAVESHLVSGGALAWRRRIRTGASTFHVKPVLALNRLLLARASAADRRGSGVDTARALEASLRLRSSFEDQPESVPALIVLALARQQCVLLRQIREVPAAWWERGLSRDLAAAAARSWQLDAWWTGTLFRDPERIRREFRPDMNPAIWRGLMWPILGSWLRASTADCSMRFHAMSTALQGAAGDGCGTVGQGRLWRTAPRANVVSHMVLGDGTQARLWRHVLDVRLEIELTRLVLEARSRRQVDGSWPAGPVRSTVCGDVHWLHRAHAGGSLTISADNDPLQMPDAMRSFTIVPRPADQRVPDRSK